MTKFYVSFGQVHRHMIDGKLFDKDCIGVIEAHNYSIAREKVFKVFDAKFCFLMEEMSDKTMKQFYPRGFINVDVDVCSNNYGRAWDEGKKVMHYDFQSIQTGDSANDWIIFVSDKQPFSSNWRDNPYCALQLKKMRSTGLRDKNYKLIYQGDIVKTPDGNYGDSDIPAGISEVKWYPDDYDPGFLMSNNTPENMPWREVEIIGNIYENPQLLEKK